MGDEKTAEQIDKAYADNTENILVINHLMKQDPYLDPAHRKHSKQFEITQLYVKHQFAKF